nr:TatD family hydrolase [Pseudenhygromyxa sp. WMMC2535]
MYFFDTHAHIQRSAPTDEPRFTELVQNATEAGLRAILVPAICAQDWDQLADLPQFEDLKVRISLGIHPYSVSKLTPEVYLSQLEELQLRAENAPSHLCAIGECGLDFQRAGRDPDARAHQVRVFRAQLELARRLGMPLTIHCVKAHGLMLELLRERPTPPSVMHAYSGSAELGRALVQAGHYLSFAANVCIPGARKVVEAARATPAERLLIETDSPDQTPPGRGDVDNEPAFIVDVAERLADLRGEPLEELAAQTTANACRLFGVDLDAPN